MSCFGGKRKEPPSDWVPEHEPSRKERVRNGDALRRAGIQLETLSDLLDDDFASDYLLAFAQSEFSSENVAFLLAVREFDARVADDGADAEALQMAQQIVAQHVQLGADLEVVTTTRQRCAIEDFVKAWDKDGIIDGFKSPRSVFASLYRAVYRNVVFEVLPRFLYSGHCEELSLLHLSKTLLLEGCREPLRARLNGNGQAALKLWIDAHRFEREYTSLASGWPTEASVERARGVFQTHQPTLAKLCSAAQLKQLGRKVPEAPVDLFRTPMLAALNTLAPAYEEFLATEPGRALLEHLQVQRLPRPSDKPQPLQSSQAYATGW